MDSKAARATLVQRRHIIEGLTKEHTQETEMEKLVRYQGAIEALDAALEDEQAHGTSDSRRGPRCRGTIRRGGSRRVPENHGHG
jgi:hypothetical protein